MIFINEKISIFEKNISYKAIKSSGPGGQNINKVSTGICLKYNLNHHRYPSWFIKNLKKYSGSLLSKNKVLTIKANSYRSQIRNKEDALNRIIKLFKKSCLIKKKRIKTNPSKAIQKKRIESKRKKSLKKELRKPLKYHH